MTIRVGVLGVGAIGGAVAEKLSTGSVEGACLVALADRPSALPRLEALGRSWGCRFTADPNELPALGATLVVEAAGVSAVREHAVPLLQGGVSLLLMSVGALADPEMASAVTAAARDSGQRVYLPSGALAGLDGLLAAREGGIDVLRITTRKSPLALRDAPHVRAEGWDLMRLREPQVVFQGSVRDAIAGFPANANVAVTLALASGANARVVVTIIADPAARLTRHTVEVEGAFGSMRVEVNNHPSPTNPGTSALAALSAIATLRKIHSAISIA